MKKLMLIAALVCVVFASNAESYYDKYLTEAYEALARGDLERAGTSYTIYSQMVGQDPEFERLFAEANSPLEQEKRALANDCWLLDLDGSTTLAVCRNIPDYDCTYQGASDMAAGCRVGGFSNWRFPTTDELRIILASDLPLPYNACFLATNPSRSRNISISVINKQKYVDGKLVTYSKETITPEFRTVMSRQNGFQEIEYEKVETDGRTTFRRNGSTISEPKFRYMLVRRIGTGDSVSAQEEQETDTITIHKSYKVTRVRKHCR